jgi:hypothetical protein
MHDIVIFLSVLQQSPILKLERTGQLLLDEGLKLHHTEKLVEAMGRLLLQDTTGCPAQTDSTSSVARPEQTGLLIDWLASVEPELIGSCTPLQVSPKQSLWLLLHSVKCNLF